MQFLDHLPLQLLVQMNSKDILIQVELCFRKSSRCVLAFCLQWWHWTQILRERHLSCAWLLQRRGCPCSLTPAEGHVLARQNHTSFPLLCAYTLVVLLSSCVCVCVGAHVDMAGGNSGELVLFFYCEIQEFNSGSQGCTANTFILWAISPVFYLISFYFETVSYVH